MDFFILFAAMGLVALARITVGLTAAPYGAMDWAAVRAQIIVSLGAEAVASRAQREEATKRKAAKRHRRWARKAEAAEGRAKALAAAKAARLAVRAAAKAAARAKSAAVAARYGHAAQRAAAAVRSHRRLVAAVGTVPLAGYYGIKARKRATRGSGSATNALKRATRLSVAQQRNAAARAAADAANAAFAAKLAARQAAREAKLAEAKLAEAKLADLLAKFAAREAKLAAREAKLADLLAKRDAVRLAHAVVRAKAKASRKEGFVQWLDENGHNVRGQAFVAANEAAWTAAKAEEGYMAHFGFSAECVVAADKAAFEWRSVQRAVRQAKVVAA